MSNRVLIFIIWILSSMWTNIYGQGLEIYLVKQEYPDFTKEQPEGICHYCFEPKKIDLFDSALVKESNIEYFDWEHQTIKLNDSGLKIIKSLIIPIQGLAVAITIDKEPIYGFWLWNYVSSFGCDWVFAYPDLVFRIEYGLPSRNTKGNDPRYNKLIEDYIIKMKLKK